MTTVSVERESKQTFPVYQSLPDDLMSVQDASEEFGIARQTIYQWLTDKAIRHAGYVLVGRKAVSLVYREEIAARVTTDDPDNIPVFAEIPEGLGTIPSVARIFRMHPNTLRNQVNRGDIQIRGKISVLPFSCKGKFLVSIREVEKLVGHPPVDAALVG